MRSLLAFEIPKLAFDVANVVIFAAILVGVALRRRRLAHVRIMTASFVADVLMVAVIELQRGAVAKTLEQARTVSDGLLSFHIFVSVASLALWVYQLVGGRRILHGAGSLSRHRAGAWAFLVFRATNVGTAFFV
ncbi:MAG TPA: hypothetical protein VEI02_04420 [Planctomycetota bacterium]|nr:hypothetical protein [Planctomycetota bacterium]